MPFTPSRQAPEGDDGIGDWSPEAYVRSMREGVDHEGNHFSPAFPYEYVARITDADLEDHSISLIDAECRCHDHPNLFIGGPSGFSTGDCGLADAMIAET